MSFEGQAAGGQSDFSYCALHAEGRGGSRTCTCGARPRPVRMYAVGIYACVHSRVPACKHVCMCDACLSVRTKRCACAELPTPLSIQPSTPPSIYLHVTELRSARSAAHKAPSQPPPEPCAKTSDARPSRSTTHGSVGGRPSSRSLTSTKNSKRICVYMCMCVYVRARVSVRACVSVCYLVCVCVYDTPTCRCMYIRTTSEDQKSG